MSESQRELVRLQHTATERRIYFLLAGAGTALGFAATQADSLIIGWPNQFLFCAVTLWALSFFCGMRALSNRTSFISANDFLLRQQSANHPAYHELIKAVADEAAFEPIARRISRYSTAQLWMLMVGAVVFFLWRIASAYPNFDALLQALAFWR